MKVQGQQKAEDVKGDTETFVNFARRLMQVPRSEIQAGLDAEKAIRERRGKPFKKMSDLSSRVPPASSKGR